MINNSQLKDPNNNEHVEENLVAEEDTTKEVDTERFTIPQEIRNKLARQLRGLRKLEKESMIPNPEHNKKRDRSAFQYVNHLQGLQGTLNYVLNLPVKTIVDIGAGTTRAIGEIAKSTYGNGLKFIATGIVNHTDIEKNIGYKNYRLTSAEVMRGFQPESVGGFLSVYGPLYYSNYEEIIFGKMDELLVPGGITKFCIMKDIPGSKINKNHAEKCQKIEEIMKKLGYGVATKNWQIFDFGIQGNAFNQIFIGIKPGKDSRRDLNEVAGQIMEEDLEQLESMRCGF